MNLLSPTIPFVNRSEEGKIFGNFYPLQRQELLAWRDAGLIKGAAYLGFCLRLENPFADKPIRINVDSFCQKWNIKIPSYFRQLRELKNIGFLQIHKAESFISLSTIKNDSNYQNRESTIKNDSSTIKNDSSTIKNDSSTIKNDNFQVWEYATEADLSDCTPQTYSDFIQIDLDCVRQEPEHEPGTATPNKIKCSQTEDYSTTPSDVNCQVVNHKDLSRGSLSAPTVDPFFNRRPKPQDLIWDWVPEGPWKLESGKLDENLVDFEARRWMAKYKDLVDIHDARKQVRAYFKKDPTRLANDWQEYQEFNAIKLANMGLRSQNGVKVHDDERAQIEQHRNAFKENPHSITAPNTGEVKQYKQWIDDTAPPQQLQQGKQTIYIEAEREIDWDAIARKTQEFEQRQSTVIPEGAENPQAYINKPNEEDREYYRHLYESRQNSTKKDTPSAGKFPGVQNERMENVGTAIANHLEHAHSMKMLTQEEKRRLSQEQAETRKIAHWNGLLASGLETCIYEATRQARAAGYDIVDGQVVEMEF